MTTRAAESSSSEDAAVIDEAFVDTALDAAGFGCFQLVAIPACGLAAMSQSLQTNLLAYLQPCAGAAFGVPAQRQRKTALPPRQLQHLQQCEDDQILILKYYLRI